MTLPEGASLYARIKSRLTRQDGIAFLSAFLFGLLTHLYMLTNKLPNFDDIYCNYTDNRLAVMGRWFLFIPSAISSSLSLPWVNGLISILALSGVCLLIVKLFEMKRTFCIVLMSAIVISFPVVSDTLAFMFTADAYFIGLLLGVAGVFVTDRWKWGFLPGGVLLSLSLGCYQAYIFFCVGLIGMRGVEYLLDPSKDDRQILRLILRFVAALVIAAAIYLAVTKTWCAVTGRELGGHQGQGSASLPSLAELLKRVYRAYAEYWHCVTKKGEIYFTLYQRILFLLSNGACVGLILLSALYVHKKSALQTALLAILVLLFPLMFNGIHLVGAKLTYSLMEYALCLPLVFVLVLYDVFSRRTQRAQWRWKRAFTLASGYLIAAGFAILSIHQAVHTNQKYSLLEMKFDNCFALCNRIIDRVEQVPTYSEDSVVWVQGEATTGNWAYSALKHSELPLFGNTHSVGFTSSYSLLYDGYETYSFIRDYIGVVYPWPDGERVAVALATDAFREMPFFPMEGSVKDIGGVIVVRLGAE